MGDFEELVNKLNDDIELSNDYLNKTTKLVEGVPHVQRWKEGKETSLKILYGLPKDRAEELAPLFLSWEKASDNVIKSAFPVVTDVSPLFIQAVESSSGSPTPYIVNATNAALEYEYSNDVIPEWVPKVTAVIDAHTQKIQQEDYLPKRLNKIYSDLGKMYEIAVESFHKCQAKIIGIDQSAIQLRGVIEKVWSGLVYMARQKNTNPKLNMKYLELKKQGDQDLVATILETTLFPKIKILELLDNAYLLHKNISDSKFGKNILGKDMTTLDLYYDQWITFLDGISGIVV